MTSENEMDAHSVEIGITGTQRGLTEKQFLSLQNLLRVLHMNKIHAGDCVGVDAETILLVKELRPEVITVGHPPTNPRKRAFLTYDEERKPLDYIPRNHAIVDESDYLIACPKEFTEVLRSGTWATIRYAREMGKSVIIILPDGTWSE